MDVRQPPATPGRGATVIVTPELLWKRRAVLEGVAGLLHKATSPSAMPWTPAAGPAGRPTPTPAPGACTGLCCG